MKPKDKSIDDVWRQMERCRDNYHTFDNTKVPTPWLKKSFKIAKFYLDNIATQITLDRLENDPNNRKVKFSHAVRSFMYDTPLDAIRQLKPWRKDGLYFYYNGVKLTPWEIWFGIDTRLFREDGEPCGKAYFHYDNALHPVYLPDGTQYRERGLANVTCDYKDGILSNFRYE